VWVGFSVSCRASMSLFNPIFETRARKLARCGKCEGCTRVECGECGSCADKPRFGGPGVKKQACEARKCLRMSRQREEAEPMPKKRAKGGAQSEWGDKPALLQDLDILSEIDLASDHLDRDNQGPMRSDLPIDVAALETSSATAACASATRADKGEKGDKKVGPRLRRCGKCLPCNRGDCGSCHNCADKPKFGGSGVKKQACVARRCVSMLRRDSTPSPTLGCADDVGASPTGVIDLWDSANWSKQLTDPLAAEPLEEADKPNGEVLSYQAMLGEAALLPGEGLEDSDTGKDDSLLQMGGTAWSDACLAAVQLSMDGTTIGGNMSAEEGSSASDASTDGPKAEDESPPQGDEEALPATVKFSMEAPTEPMEDGINLGDETRQTFPLRLEGATFQAPPSKAAHAEEQTPRSPLSPQTEEGGTGVTDLASLEMVGLDSDDPLSVLNNIAHDLSPDDLSSTPSGDPTGGVDDPFDEEDYCGWLAEDI